VRYNSRDGSTGKAGGMNLLELTPDQKALVKIWQKIGHKSNLPYMLLNHTTVAEQEEMVRVYQMAGLLDVGAAD
jgi:hypothetical protein